MSKLADIRTDTLYLVGMPPEGGFITIADRIPIFVNPVDASLFALINMIEYPATAGKIGTFTIARDDTSTLERFIESSREHNEKYCLYQGLMAIQKHHIIKAWIRFNKDRPFPCAKTKPVSVDVLRTGVNIADCFPSQRDPEKLGVIQELIKASAEVSQEKIESFCEAALWHIIENTVYREKPNRKMAPIQLLMREGQKGNTISEVLSQSKYYH